MKNGLATGIVCVLMEKLDAMARDKQYGGCITGT
jgi:hypothetical protein